MKSCTIIIAGWNFEVDNSYHLHTSWTCV